MEEIRSRSGGGASARRGLLVMLAFGLAAAITGGATASASAPSPSQRAAALVGRMTLGEELSLVGSGLQGLPRLGIPAMSFTDGPNGVGNGATGVTAFPAAVSIAASWDPALALRYGAALGGEAAGQGHVLIGAPTINIVRSPLWGRAAETLGEDPFLTGQMAASEVRGIQSQRVIAQVKHYAANNQEVGRFGSALLAPAVDVRVSDRALREIYLPGFRAAVGPGGAASVMCSYNRINGTPSCQRPDTLADLRAFGLRGFVGPDATLAVRDVLAAAKAGVNNFQLGSIASAGGSSATAYSGGGPETKILGDAVANGTLPRRVIDTGARDILIAFDRVGLLAHPKLQHRAVVSTAAHRRLATLISAEATVLLRNRGRVLPLTNQTRSIAVIGHDAGAGTQIEENGSPAVVPGRVITPLAGIRARAPKGTRVSYTPGTKGVVALPVVPTQVLTPASGVGHGLAGTYFAGTDFSGAPILHTTAPTLDFASTRAPLQPIPGTTAGSARWTGTLTPPTSGIYQFSLAVSGLASLSVNGRVIVSGNTEWITAAPQDPGALPISFHGHVRLTAHHPVKLSVAYSTGVSIAGAELHVGWEPPNPGAIARAVATARHAQVAVVFANDSTSEGMDRTSLALPGDQDRLIAAVAKANPRTVVVLHTSGPVLMPWRSKVAAILAAWYPGQQSGAAIAETLYGDVDPSGRLPVTFPDSESQGPTANNPARYPGVGDVVRYGEGIFVGYRFYDRDGERPLFPFGFGLSYTSFSLSGLKVVRSGSDRFDATVRVRNAGRRSGAEVVQLYVGDPARAGEPPRQLKAFAKVFLRPGAAQNVRLKLDRSSFQVFDGATGSWKTIPGIYRIYAGTSSRDLPLVRSVQLP